MFCFADTTDVQSNCHNSRKYFQKKGSNSWISDILDKKWRWSKYLLIHFLFLSELKGNDNSTIYFRSKKWSVRLATGTSRGGQTETHPQKIQVQSLMISAWASAHLQPRAPENNSCPAGYWLCSPVRVEESDLDSSMHGGRRGEKRGGSEEK